MNRIKIARLIATSIAVIHHINLVQSEPAVRKAASQAFGDLGMAAKSIGNVVTEVRSAWARSTPGSSFGMAT